MALESKELLRRRPALGRGDGGRPEARRRPPEAAPVQRRLRRLPGRRRSGPGWPPPDDAAKAKLRGQALAWLRAELTAWTKLLESGPPQARPAIVRTLGQWLRDTDLAGIRDAAALARLPAEERKAFAQLWADVVDVVVDVHPFVKRVAALPAAEQVEQVRKELKKRNPGYDGTLTPTTENGAVIGLEFTTDHVTDISPVRALTRLQRLRIWGSRGLTGERSPT